MTSPTSSSSVSQDDSVQATWHARWWQLMSLTCIGYFIYTGKLSTELNVVILLLALGNFTDAELGNRISVLRRMGDAAIATTFIPACLKCGR